MVEKNKLQITAVGKEYPVKDYNKKKIEFTNIQLNAIDPNAVWMYIKISNEAGHTKTKKIDFSYYKDYFRCIANVHSIDASEIKELKRLPTGLEKIEISFNRTDRKKEIDIEVYFQTYG